MRSSFRLLALAVATVFSGSVARAQVIASTFGAGDTFHPQLAYWVSTVSPYGQKFVYTGGSGFELFQVRVALYTSTGLTVRILEGAENVQPTVLESWSLASFTPPLNRGIATFTSTGGLLLKTNATYWLSVTATDGYWYLNDQDYRGAWRLRAPSEWVENADSWSAAYDVTARPSTVVPEPATVTLLAAGLLGLGVAARRRARAS